MDKNIPSKYLELLPAVYRSSEFLGRFLKAFEKELSGMDDGVKEPPVKGINEILDRIHEYFDPLTTPREFLEWLAGWAALALHKWEWRIADEEAVQRIPLDEAQERKLVRKLIPLYNKRGTLKGLQDTLDLYLEGIADEVLISELKRHFIVGDPEGVEDLPETNGIDDKRYDEVLDRAYRDKLSSVVGVSTVVNEGLPYYFRVYVVLPLPQVPALLLKKKSAVRDIIEHEKPAYAYCTLKLRILPVLTVGKRCTVGRDTLIGVLTI